MEVFMALLNDLAMKMIEYYKNDPGNIDHLIKVHAYAKLIAEEEHIDKELLLIVESSAYLHDIGIKNALAKYNSAIGELQEKEGPDEARKILIELGYEDTIIERICYIIGHHHTYDAIDNIDFQIVVEANLIANYYEEKLPKENILYSYDKVFKTETGKLIMENIYNLY
jgi:HD superfamily phosphodiesterase